MDGSYTPEERRLIALWEQHVRLEFADRDAAATVDTMSDENYVNHVPVMTGGRGRDEMLEFYGKHFIPKMPADTAIPPVCRTGVGADVTFQRADPPRCGRTGLRP
jgi:carboxymethylenebutenolidase